MSFMVNRRGDIYKSGTAFSLQKRLQVIKSAILTGSIADAAREDHVSDRGHEGFCSIIH